MASVYLIENTEGTLKFTLHPGSINGPGGTHRDTDLRLYGLGSHLWGEGVNENFYRLIENFACPEKTFNDYNPNSGLYDFDPGFFNGVLPKDERDLGPGKGINAPIIGQTWFNTTTKQLYVLTDIDKTNPNIPRHVWVTVDNAGGSPSNLASIYVNKSGDTMTGPLTLSSDPQLPMHAATKQYVDASFIDPSNTQPVGSQIPAVLSTGSYPAPFGTIDASSQPLTVKGDTTPEDVSITQGTWRFLGKVSITDNIGLWIRIS